MFTSIDLLPLSTEIKTCLKLHGFTCVEDCLKFTPKQLEEVLRLNFDVCKHILDVIHENDVTEMLNVKIETALENYLYFSEKIPIISLCKSIDDLIGGFFTGQLYEIFGESGTGKTQLCYQLCCNVQIPTCLGGNEGEALYIDTEKSFRPERLIEISQETIETLNYSTSEYKLNLTCENMLNNVKWVYCNHPNKLSSLILYHLENFLQQNIKIKLIIFDSIAYQFRYGFEDNKRERTKTLVLLSQKIKFLAYKYDVCIILINQVTFSLNCDEMIAALDSIWGHTSTIQIKLNKFEKNIKYANLKKAAFRHNNKAFYLITKSGLIDVKLDTELKMNEEIDKQTTHEMSQLFTQIYK